MNIIVVGAGKVGVTIASYLCDENHDVTVIDKREHVLEELMNGTDIQAVCGDGAICSVLTEAEVEKAYLVIATTGSDEINLLCCMTARKMGARHCIARVRNPNYIKQIPFMRTQLGLSMIVNPDFQTAIEISRSLRFPSAIKIEGFSKNRVDLIELKVDANSKLLGLSLTQLSKMFNVKMLVCAIKSGEKVIIPKGDVVLKEGDKIHVTASHAHLNKFFKSIGILKNPIKTVMIIGGGRVSFYLAQQLEEIGMSVKIIENNADTCMTLSERLPKTTIIHGDGTRQELLLEEGIETVDACISLTGIDEENMIISMYAGTKNVRKIVTKINRTALINLAKSFGNDSIVSTKETTANTILQYIRAKQNAQGNSIKTLTKLVDGRAEALEFFVSTKSKWLNIPLKNLKIRNDAIIAGIVRSNATVIPNGNDVIKFNDNVIVVTTSRHIKDMEDIFEDF